jgi:AraC-like DNA-binding protein
MLAVPRRIVSADFTDIEQYGRSQSDGDVDHIQIQAGRLRLHMAHAELGPVTVQANRLEGSYVAHGAINRSRFAIFFDIGETPGASRLNGFTFRRSGGVAYGPGAELFGRGEHGQDWAMVTLDRHLGETEFDGALLAREGACEVVPDLLGRAPGLAVLARELSGVICVDPARLHGEAVAAAVSDAVVGQLAAALPGGGGAGRPVRAGRAQLRLVGAALEMLDAALDSPVYTPLVGRELGVGRRTLNDAFRAVYGMTLQRYLVLRRLNLARRALLSAAGPTLVKQIALDVGFWHFGRFSLAYRDMFGEMPSETLARRGA